MGIGDNLKLKALATVARLDGSLSKEAYQRMTDGTVSSIDWIIADGISADLSKAVSDVMDDQQAGDTVGETIKDSISVTGIGIERLWKKVTEPTPQKTTGLVRPSTGVSLRG